MLQKTNVNERGSVNVQVFIDTESVKTGTLVDDWKMLPPKRIPVRCIELMPFFKELCTDCRCLATAHPFY
jgi:hypothetical protein